MELEMCCICDKPTEKCGRSEDSFYVEIGNDETGPLCEECFTKLLKIKETKQ